VSRRPDGRRGRRKPDPAEETASWLLEVERAGQSDDEGDDWADTLRATRREASGQFPPVGQAGHDTGSWGGASSPPQWAGSDPGAASPAGWRQAEASGAPEPPTHEPQAWDTQADAEPWNGRWPFEESGQSWEPDDRSYTWPAQELASNTGSWEAEPAPAPSEDPWASSQRGGQAGPRGYEGAVYPPVAPPAGGHREPAWGSDPGYGDPGYSSEPGGSVYPGGYEPGGSEQAAGAWDYPATGGYGAQAGDAPAGADPYAGRDSSGEVYAPGDPYAAGRDPYATPADQYPPAADRYAPSSDPYASAADQYPPAADRYPPAADPYASAADPYASAADPYAPSADPYASAADQYPPTADQYPPTADQYLPNDAWPAGPGYDGRNGTGAANRGSTTGAGHLTDPGRFADPGGAAQEPYPGHDPFAAYGLQNSRRQYHAGESAQAAPGSADTQQRAFEERESSGPISGGRATGEIWPPATPAAARAATTPTRPESWPPQTGSWGIEEPPQRAHPGSSGEFSRVLPGDEEQAGRLGRPLDDRGELLDLGPRVHTGRGSRGAAARLIDDGDHVSHRARWPRVVALISWIILLMVLCWFYVFPWLEKILPENF
jgi:hypothetical protein